MANPSGGTGPGGDAGTGANICHAGGMKALLSGGPAEGVVEAGVVSRDGRVWTINVVHVNCACEWCANVGAVAVAHIYERRDDDVFAYRLSREARDGD